MALKWVHRRDFLRMGSAAAAGIAATTLSAKTLDTIARIEGVDPILSVGYADVAGVETAGVIPAERLSSGDARFSSTAARVTVHGLWEAEAREKSPIAVYVSVFFGEVPFMAWSSAGSISPRLSFTIDAGQREHLSFGIERDRVIGARTLRSRVAGLFGFGRSTADHLLTPEVLEQSGGLCSLGIGRGAGPKLRAGSYFIALRRSPSDRTPDWRSVKVDANELRTGGAEVLRSGDAPVAFDYLAVSVSHT